MKFVNQNFPSGGIFVFKEITKFKFTLQARCNELDVFCKDVFLAPLAKLINRSFHNGVFPNILKKAEVIPIYKSESRVACSNYRPISLLSNIGKIIEKFMHKHLYSSGNIKLLLPCSVWFPTKCVN